ncbi:hypothetical protein, partial [Citrobacter freundii]
RPISPAQSRFRGVCYGRIFSFLVSHSEALSRAGLYENDKNTADNNLQNNLLTLYLLQGF